MKFKYEDNYFKYYSIFYKGVEIIFLQKKSDGELMMLFTDEMVQKLFGFENFEKMLQDKEIQKITHQVFAEVGQPLFFPAFDNDKIEKN